VEAKGLLSMDELIIAGDLNFTTSTEEVLGAQALCDPLAGFSKELFANNHLVDIQPTKLVPTWRNGRSRGQGIQKRLDRIYVSETLLGDVVRYKSWVELMFISNHAPVLFQLDYGQKNIAYPFKFNHACLHEESFGDLVRSVWCEHQGFGEEGAQSRLV
jgi:endonuclease/exonuclease/phosphatase family metal-dependent hydrolase